MPHFEQLSWQTEHCQTHLTNPGVNTQYSLLLHIFSSIFLQIKLEKRKKALSEYDFAQVSQKLHVKLEREDRRVKDTDQKTRMECPGLDVSRNKQKKL